MPRAPADDPVRASFRNHFRCLIEIFGGNQMSNCLLPILPLQKMFGVALVFRSDTVPANLAAKTTLKKTLEERVKTVLFSTTIAGYSQENISSHQIRKYARTIDAAKQCPARVELYAI